MAISKAISLCGSWLSTGIGKYQSTTLDLYSTEGRGWPVTATPPFQITVPGLCNILATYCADYGGIGSRATTGSIHEWTLNSHRG